MCPFCVAMSLMYGLPDMWPMSDLPLLYGAGPLVPVCPDLPRYGGCTRVCTGLYRGAGCGLLCTDVSCAWRGCPGMSCF